MLSGKNEEPKTTQDCRVRTAPAAGCYSGLQMPGHHAACAERGPDEDPEHRRKSGNAGRWAAPVKLVVP